MIRAVFGAFLDLPGWAIFLSLVLFYAATGGLMHWLCFRPKWRETAKSFDGVAPPFFMAPAVIFALMVTFLAADVWQRDRLAENGVFAERDAVQEVYDMAGMAGASAPDLRAAVRDYIASVVHDEWPRMIAGSGEASQTGQALATLTRLAMDKKIGDQLGTAVHNALVGAILRVTAARSDRLVLASGQFDELKWSFVLLLGVIGQIGVAVVHLERPRPQVLALCVFTASAIGALTLLGICEEPYQGSHQVSPAPLEALLR